MIVPSRFANLLEPNIREVFTLRAQRTQSLRDTLFNVSGSGVRLEHYTGIGGRRIIPVYDGVVPTETFDQYYKTDILNVTFMDSIQVEKDLLEDDQMNEIGSRAASFSDAFADTIDYDASQIFANGFTDSGTYRTGESTNGADGVGLMSAAHPMTPIQSGTTQSNEATLALSMDNAITVHQRMVKWTTDKDSVRMGIRPNALLVPIDLLATAREIFPRDDSNTPYAPGSAEFSPNFFNSRIGDDPVTVLVWDTLTDTNAWFMIDLQQAKRHLRWQVRVAPSVTQVESGNSNVAQWDGRMRYGAGWTHWAWIYGNNPS